MIASAAACRKENRIRVVSCSCCFYSYSRVTVDNNKNAQSNKRSGKKWTKIVFESMCMTGSRRMRFKITSPVTNEFDPRTEFSFHMELFFVLPFLMKILLSRTMMFVDREKLKQNQRTTTLFIRVQQEIRDRNTITWIENQSTTILKNDGDN